MVMAKIVGSGTFYTLISTIENKERKQTLLILTLMKTLLVSNKDLYQVHCSLISTSVTHFRALTNLI